MDPDIQEAEARKEFNLTEKQEPDEKQLATVTKKLLKEAVKLLATNSKLRKLLGDIKKQFEQIIYSSLLLFW